MAVYTEVSGEDLVRFLAAYDAGELYSCKGIAEGVENTNYMVHTASGFFILTLYEKRVSRADLPFFLGLMEHLAAAGFPCPAPVRDRKGGMVGELSGRAAALIAFLEGFSLRRPRAGHCQAAGEALARLHKAGEGFPLRRENTLGPSGWRPLFARFQERADEIAPGLAGLMDSEIRELGTCWPAGLPQGIIHADFFPDNVFFLGGRLSGVIDFYFACNDALAYDVAIALNAWCFEPDCSFNVTKGRALLRGYESVRPLAAAERAAMPVLARGAALRFLLTRAHDWLLSEAGALVHHHDPMEYVRRVRFHQGVRDIAGYGCEVC